VALSNGTAPAGVQDNGGNSVADAIHIYVPNGSITVSNNNNTTTNDARYGIWSIPGTASGTGNTSTSDPNQCNPLNLSTYS
jgi:hypothetical protein